MAATCKITGKRTVMGGGYSNRTRATKFNPTGRQRKRVNMQKKRIFVPEMGKKIKVKASTKGLRALKKRGMRALTG